MSDNERAFFTRDEAVAFCDKNAIPLTSSREETYFKSDGQVGSHTVSYETIERRGLVHVVILDRFRAQQDAAVDNDPGVRIAALEAQLSAFLAAQAPPPVTAPVAVETPATPVPASVAGNAPAAPSESVSTAQI
jgi:hypothetical protein